MKSKQLDLETESCAAPHWHRHSNATLMKSVLRLLELHRSGALGGEQMPEDVNPGLPKEGQDNYHFFSLCMALNYQRDSYRLWPAGTAAFNDPECVFLFRPSQVVARTDEEVRSALLKHRVALQPVQHTRIWKTICTGIVDAFEGDIRTLFNRAGFSVIELRRLVQEIHKKRFPYLSGSKIFNYWLYVLEQYAGAIYPDRELISVAPDTHVIQASVRIGLVDPNSPRDGALQAKVVQAWVELLRGTGLAPIDVHTPLWLWSRLGLPPLIGLSESAAELI